MEPDPLAAPPDLSALITQERRDRVRGTLARRVGSVVAVAESVHRRHNTSAILRSCESFGVHEVHLISEGFSPSVGAARGAERWVHCRNFSTIDDSLDALEARGFRIFVADFSQPSWSPEEVPVDQPLAVVLGTEAAGVSARARQRAYGAITIPMYGLTASLNVSVSAAIILRALADRRRALAGPDLSAEEQERFYQAWISEELQARRGLLNRTS